VEEDAQVVTKIELEVTPTVTNSCKLEMELIRDEHGWRLVAATLDASLVPDDVEELRAALHAFIGAMPWTTAGSMTRPVRCLSS
jgi:hypothetical protein